MDLSKINKKLVTYIGIGIGAIVLIFIILFVIKLIAGSVISYDKIENKMIAASKKYYAEEGHILPKENEKATVTAETLSTEKYMKPLTKMVKKDVTCSGEVVVTNNGKEYTYTPYLDCGENYKTIELYKEITKESNLVTTGAGLYYINGSYVYRGEYVNNYVKYADQLWRIISIDKEGHIKLLQEENSNKSKWDDRYNTTKKSSTGISDYTVSRIYESISNIINGFKDTDLAKLYKHNICIAGRTTDESGKDGTIECKKVFENQYAGLLRTDEFLLASIDSTCNKIENQQCAFWMLTPDGETTHLVYKLTNGNFNKSTANSDGYIRMTIMLNNNTLYKSGEGTKEKPYLLK